MGVLCDICSKTLSSRSVYNRHVKLVHEKKVFGHPFEMYNAKCLDCRMSFLNVIALRDHLIQMHNIEPDKQVLHFDSLEDFQNWFQKICLEDKSHYVKEKGSHKFAGKTTTLYNCHRSKISTVQLSDTDERRKRVKKRQGSCKMNFLCTSQIKVTEANGRVEVIYFRKHYGHGKDVEHLKLRKEVRQKVANMLAQGLPTSRVLENIMETVESGRERLIKRKDINNIRVSYGINKRYETKRPKTIETRSRNNNGIKRRKTDVVSMDVWVQEEIDKGEHSSILFYKPQGEAIENLNDKDFCLIIMDEFQQNMLEEFGDNIIYIDSTHGLNKFDFELTTVMVVDEYCEGFPTACMFSNRVDNDMLILFFKCIIDKIGCVFKPKTLMSDLSNLFINAWEEVMGPPELFVYCNWHVDRVWRSSLKKIRNPEKRSWVYNTLKHLQCEVSEEEFFTKLDKSIHLFSSNLDLIPFSEYFEQNFAENYQQWALCFRQECGISTNMYIGAMHKVIKYSHVDGKIVKRLDRALYDVLKYIKQKTLGRIKKSGSNKTSKKKINILSRHRIAQNAKLTIEYTTGSPEYVVIDNDNSLNQNRVTELSDKMCCKMSCDFCQICIHCFKCTCVDYLSRNIICKHIHFVLIHMPEIANVECIANEDVDHTQSNYNSNDDSGDKIKFHVDNVDYKIYTDIVENIDCYEDKADYIDYRDDINYKADKTDIIARTIDSHDDRDDHHEAKNECFDNDPDSRENNSAYHYDNIGFQENVEENKHLDDLNQNKTGHDITVLKTNIVKQINKIRNKLYNVSNENILSQIFDQLKNANSLLNNESNSNIDSFVEESNEPPKKKMKKQFIIISAKKENDMVRVDQKPNLGEQKVIIERTLEPELYVSQSGVNDHRYA